MDNTNRKRYFAASNSADGFVNYFPQIFGRQNCSSLYVIKGGPGTGKSRFMRDVATAAEERGLEVEYYHCSSDPTSLDGIVIGELRLGMLDGTAPHAYEPSSVGVREHIINLGEFWNEELLISRREDIERLSAEKSRAYGKAYSLLSAYGGLLDAESAAIAPCVDRKKLNGTVKRCLHKLPVSPEPAENIALCRAVGMDGRTKFNTYEEGEGLLFTVSDSYDSAHFFMNELVAEAGRRGMSLDLSFDPIMPSRVDAVRLRDIGITFVVGDDGDRRINLRRFISEEKLKPQKEWLRGIRNSLRGLDILIDQCFDEIKKKHFELEEIYCGAMDFEQKEEYTKKIIKKIFK